MPTPTPAQQVGGEVGEPVEGSTWALRIGINVTASEDFESPWE